VTRSDVDHRSDGDLAAAWARSGMLWLTGRAEGEPLGAPRALVDGVRVWAAELARRSAELGTRVVVDPLALLAQRAAVAGLARAGDVSCGGGSHLLASADGWVAASLARPADWEAAAAWLGRPGPMAEGDWAGVAAGVAGIGTDELRAGAELLGLPVGVLGERRRVRVPAGPRPSPGVIHGVDARRVGTGPAVRSSAEAVVVDLSSLWAGPLAGRLLARAGARVVKVESTTRPDGARRGPPRFFRLLNAGKDSVALDFGTAEGRRHLTGLVSQADVVITGSRPRALQQLGLDLETMVAHGRPRVWLSVTGYGIAPGSGHRVAFGDDAAVAGGLVAFDDRGPCFCGDAIADPLSGLASAVAVLTALGLGGSWVVDASMADIAGGLTGPAFPVTGLRAAPPPEPDDGWEAATPAFGADTEAVVAGLPPA
jgi:hypothetical protein